MTEKSTGVPIVPQPWVVACFEVPGYGGAAGMAHRLAGALDEVHPTICLNLISAEHRDFYLYKFGEHWKNPLGLPRVSTCYLPPTLEAQRESLHRFLQQCCPSLVLAVGYVAGRLLHSQGFPVIYLAWGCREMTARIEQGSFVAGDSLQDVRPAKAGGETEVVDGVDYLVCDSPLTVEAFTRFWPAQSGKIHPISLSLERFQEAEARRYLGFSKPFEERSIDLMFSASNWERETKNFPFAKQLKKRFPHLRVKFLGEGPVDCVEGLVASREKYFRLLGNTKVLVCPSVFDSAPGVLYEARQMGCNVVASRGCGNAFLAGETGLVRGAGIEEYIEPINKALTRPLSPFPAPENHRDIMEELPGIAQVFQRTDSTCSPSYEESGGEPVETRDHSVTVVMPARNEALHIRQALLSVLAQGGSRLRVIVVDDASTDDTVAVVQALGDARVQIIENEKRMGIGYCHNRALAECRTPYLCHVDADDWILPGGLAGMVGALEANPQAGMAHCRYLTVDARGECSREEYERQHQEFEQAKERLDYQRLLRHRCVINHFRTYRTSVLRQLGGFREDLEVGEDWEMALRLLRAGFEIEQVRRFYYCYRLHAGNHSESGALRLLSYHPATNRLIFRWPRSLGKRVVSRHVRRLSVRMKRMVKRIYFRRVSPALLSFYQRLRRWASTRPPVFSPPEIGRQPRLGYHLGAYPLLSETFVRREIDELVARGVDVRVLARTPGDCTLKVQAEYLEPLRIWPLLTAAFTLIMTRPRRTLKAALVGWSHGRGEPRSDLRDISLAILIAVWALKHNITHIHSPWGNEAASHALLAGLITSTDFSVQMRAYELHRNGGDRALSALLNWAPKVITNSDYNFGLLQGRVKGRLFLVREGLPLSDFNPQEHLRGSIPTVLCVARLVPQKGLEYLIRAARLLVDRGRSLRVVLAGGRAGWAAGYYYRLHALRRELDLESTVEFLGPVGQDTVRALMQSSDIFVLPAVVAPDGARDITPNTIMEAMACGLPVVSTSLTAIPELLQQGGLLVPPGQVEPLAEAMEQLLCDEDLARRLGESGRMFAQEHFTIERAARELEAAIFS